MEQLRNQWACHLTAVTNGEHKAENERRSPVSREEKAFYRAWETPDEYDYVSAEFVEALLIQARTFYTLIELDPRKSLADLRAEFDRTVKFYQERRSQARAEIEVRDTTWVDDLVEHTWAAEKAAKSRRDSVLDKLDALAAVRLKRSVGSFEKVEKALTQMGADCGSKGAFYKRVAAGVRLIANFDRAVREHIRLPSDELPF